MDLISRQAAIDAFDAAIHNIKGKDNAERMVEYLKTVIRRIKNLPSAEPETGRWRFAFHTWFCDNCGTNPTKGMGYVQSKNELYPYCPNCGSKMEDKE